MIGRCMVIFAIVVCVCTPSFATISFSGNTLTYSSPTDLDTIIDPPGLNDVAASYGVTKAAFQALNPQVIAFNGAPAPAQNLGTLVVNYDATHTLTFAFPSVLYNYGSRSSLGRGAFSGSSLQDAISTVPSTPDTLNDWFDATISTTGGRGVQSLGFCVAFRNDQIVYAGQALFTLSDGSTEGVTLPDLGGSNPEYVFIGYTAPAGKTITRVQASRTSLPGGGFVTIDDLSFVMSAASSLIGDINGDGYVNVGDLQLLVAKWGSGPGYAGPEDISGDGYVNVGDLQLLVAHWGESRKDVTPPATIVDLAASNPTTSSLTLTWTAPIDPDSACTAYDIRYSTSAITAANFSSAPQVPGAPTPASPGTNQSMTVTGLTAGTTYYFAMKTSDAVPNWSAISNLPSAATSALTDTTPPAAVTNLAAGSPTNTSITLTWTAPSDPDSPCAAYDIRYSASTITAANFSSATQVSGAVTPVSPGTNQQMVVNGLTANTTYYFAMKTSDAVPNWSAISNVPSATTANVSGNNNPILAPRDFKYLGYYVVPTGGQSGGTEWGQSFTHRYVGGQLRFLTMSFFGNFAGGGYQLIEFAPPANLGGTCTFTNHWPDIFAGTGLSTGGGGSVWIGLWYEQARERLWNTWAIIYPDDVQATYTKSMAVRTLNADGTISNAAGPWGLSGVQQRQIYGGMAAVPQWFQSAYGTGAYAAGWGGVASRSSIGQSEGPTFYTFPDPSTYTPGDIPTSDFRMIMNHYAIQSDWYAQGVPTSYDRGIRNCDILNQFDVGYWLSPAPDGVGRWTWADAVFNTGTWIETANKQGFVLVPTLFSGRSWYETSTIHCERQTAEIQVFDPNMLGQVAQGTRASWNTYPTYRWQITDNLRPLNLMYAINGTGPTGGTAGASYDPTTQRLYVFCPMDSHGKSYVVVYEVGNGNASVKDVAVNETNITGTVSGYGSGVTGLPANRACTETNDSVYETITEVATGGTSQLEQKWTFSVTGGSSVTFNIKAYHNSNSDGDDFVFAYSTDGNNWTNMVTVTKTADDGNFQSYTMPANTSGTVYVRVRDADRTAGHNNLDTIYIDEMNFTSNP